ncbi:folylpolyglutamate synthase [Elasticomyces elasticus]|nr:folylpolyglutamate synthase [Elasticomyces elasticus]
MIELGLSRISRLLIRTPLPWRAIHVAGTNGKGSVCAYISCMLDTYNRSAFRADYNLASIKHGRFTSPHLIDRWDCITIDNKTVRESTFKAVEEKVRARNEMECIEASEFELLTATAFEIFTQEKVDIGVVEVGMGGRLDATNILGVSVSTAGLELTEQEAKTFRAESLASVITKIGLDHQGFLGNTIEEIAREKAGIIKTRVPVILDIQNTDNVKSTIADVARRVHEPNPSTSSIADAVKKSDLPDLPVDQREAHWRELIEYGFYAKSSSTGPISSVCKKAVYTGKLDGIVECTVNGKGLPSHAVNNLRLALLAISTALDQMTLGYYAGLKAFDKYEIVSDMWNFGHFKGEYFALVKGMAADAVEIVWPGRLQKINIVDLLDLHGGASVPPCGVLLDGAHNEQSAKALGDYVDALYGENTCRVWLIAMSKGKDISTIIGHLIRTGDRVVATRFGAVDGMPWVQAVDPAELLNVLNSENQPVICTDADNALDALKKAVDIACEVRGPLIIAGSLYLAGDVLRLLRDVRTRLDKAPM